MYTCVDVVVHFTLDLVTMIHHKNYTCLQTPSAIANFWPTISSFMCTPYIGASLIHKSPWSCSLPQLWDLVTK